MEKKIYRNFTDFCGHYNDAENSGTGIFYNFMRYIKQHNPKMSDGDTLVYALNLMDNTNFADWRADLKDAVRRAVWTFELEQGIITEEEYLNRPANISGEVEE